MVLGFQRNAPPHLRFIVREHDGALATAVGRHRVFTLRVRVHQFKTSLSAGTIDGGMAGLKAVPGGTYHAFARLDVSVDVDAGMVFVR